MKTAGVEREVDAAITEQMPDERVAWKGVDGGAGVGLSRLLRGVGESYFLA